LAEWRIETNSPLIAVTKPLKDELFSVLSRMKR
jgi:hypothetical protein